MPLKRMSNKARHYVSWVGLRGAAPILFATYPWTAHLHNAHIIFNIVFFVTLVSLLLQGTTVPVVAKWLGLIGEKHTQNTLSTVDVDFPDDIKSSMSEITLTEEHLIRGNRIMDMPMPEKTLVVMVKREEHYFVPTGSTELEPGDILLIISDNERSLKETYAKMGIKT
jgi:cell volume regulation protein A